MARNRWPAEKPTYVWGGVVELENELTIGQELPPLVELASPRLDHPERLAQLAAELAALLPSGIQDCERRRLELAQLAAELAALTPTPPTQDPA